MKGYAGVSIKKALDARYNYLNYCEQSKIYVNELIQKYYDSEYPKQFKIFQWWYKNLTAKEFLASRLASFSPYSDELYKVYTKTDDFDYECMYVFNREYEYNTKCKAIKELCYSACGSTVYLDNRLAEFVNEWSSK